MSPLPHDPFRLPVRILSLGGVAGLAVLTLVDQGATRMFATPWILLLAGVVALPPFVLLLRLAGVGGPVRLPSPGWVGLAAATMLIPILSAVFSPYRGPSLLNAAGPLAAGCLFLLLHDWLQAEPERNRARLARALAGAAAAVALAGMLYWLGDIAGLTRAELFSATVFQLRNGHPLGHSNYTAGLMLLGLPWLARIAWQSRGPARSAAVLSAGLAMLNLFASGSRGGLLGLAVLGLAGIAASGPGWKKFLLAAAGVVAFAGLLAVANPRIRAMLAPRDPLAEPQRSNLQRTAMMEAGLAMGSDRPLLGWGPGTTPLAYPRYRQRLAGGADSVLQLHSTPVHVWAETGAAGVLAALLLGGLLAWNWRRAPVAAVTLAGYGVFALTDYQFDVPVFAAAAAALIALLATPAATPPSGRTRAGLALTLLAAAGVIVFLGTRDRTPLLNTTALAVGREPAGHDRAVALLNESLALNPDQEIAHFNLGWLLVVPDPATAEKHFLASARLVPDKGGVYFGLGLARLNQGRNADAARAFALEGINDPRFLASPWWTVPALAAQRDATVAAFTTLAQQARAALPVNTWAAQEVELIGGLAPRLGQVSPGPEANYRRERIGYPVLMRNLDLPPPIDLYDVREDPRFPASVPFLLPEKGWLPSPLLLKLLDATPADRQ
jgi:O-antigen ligase